MIARPVRVWLALILGACFTVLSATAEDVLPPLVGGELIFQQLKGSEGKALHHATGSILTHVGIIRLTGGGPFVIEARPGSGVLERSIDNFISRGVGGAYAIYRVNGIARDPDWYHPAVLAALDYHGQPYDPNYNWGGEALYGSELIRLGYEKAGLRLGNFQKFEDFDFNSPVTRKWFLEHWRSGTCLMLEWDACWKLMKDGKNRHCRQHRS